MKVTIYRMEWWEFETAKEMFAKRAEVEAENRTCESRFDPTKDRYWLKVFEKVD